MLDVLLCILLFLYYGCALRHRSTYRRYHSGKPTNSTERLVDVRADCREFKRDILGVAANHLVVRSVTDVSQA